MLADRDDGVHHGVPAAAEFACHIGHGTSVAPDVQRRPTSRTCCQRAPGRGDLGVVVAPAAATRRAAPALLAPHQPGRAAEHRQIHELDLADPVSMHDPATRTVGSTGRRLDNNAQPPRPVPDTDHVHVGQPDQERAHARSIGFQAGLLATQRLRTSLRLPEPLWRARDQPRTITQPSDAENH